MAHEEGEQHQGVAKDHADSGHGEPVRPGIPGADGQQQKQQRQLGRKIEEGLPVLPLPRQGQGTQRNRHQENGQAEQGPHGGHREPVAPCVETGGQQGQLRPQGEGSCHPRAPVLLHQGRHQGQGGERPCDREGDEEPVQAVVHGQVHDQAHQQHNTVKNVLPQAEVPGEGQILLGQLFHPAALGVLAGGEQLVLADLQNGADVPQQRDVGVAEAPLPFTDSRLGDKQALGKFLLGEPQLLAPAADIFSKGFLVFHTSRTPFLR